MRDILIKLSRGHGHGESSYASGSVNSVLHKYNATITPVDDRGDDGDRYYTVHGVEPENLESICSDLGDLDDVEAAYIKPADELP